MISPTIEVSRSLVYRIKFRFGVSNSAHGFQDFLDRRIDLIHPPSINCCSKIFPRLSLPPHKPFLTKVSRPNMKSTDPLTEASDDSATWQELLVKKSPLSSGNRGSLFFDAQDRPDLTGIYNCCLSRERSRQGVPSQQHPRQGQPRRSVPWMGSKRCGEGTPCRDLGFEVRASKIENPVWRQETVRPKSIYLAGNTGARSFAEGSG